MESQTQDSYSNFYFNNPNNFTRTNKHQNPLEDLNGNFTNTLLLTNKNNFLFTTNPNIAATQETQSSIPLTLEEKNSIIFTRIIVSAISSFACLICIIVYFWLWIRRTIENKKENRQKAEMMNQMESSEDLDEIEEDDDGKKERFLTSENMEEEKIENKRETVRLSQSSRKDNIEGVSFENVVAQNKSVSFDKKVYDPYNGDHSIIYNINLKVFIVLFYKGEIQ